jgi:uncharacterized membrane protein YeaQ/YmgE (transglycosylase-associated protein family)
MNGPARITALAIGLTGMVLSLGGCNRLAARDQLNKGVDAYKSARYEEAIGHFQKATELDPSLPMAKSYLATALAQNTALTLVGSAADVVTGLIGNITASSLTGALTVTTGDATDNGISITTGSAATSITAAFSTDTVTTNATALAQNTVLTLVGSAAEVVTGLVGDVAAGSLTGALTVTTGNAADNGISITTGSAATSITASGASDVVTVTATALGQNTALTLAGS